MRDLSILGAILIRHAAHHHVAVDLTYPYQN